MLVFNYLFKYIFQGLTSVKKKPSKSSIQECSENEIEPLQVVTKRSTRSRTKVKRRLIVIDSEEEENNEEFAQTSGVSNIQKSTHKRNEDCESDDGIVDVFKRSTRQNNHENSIKKKFKAKS